MTTTQRHISIGAMTAALVGVLALLLCMGAQDSPRVQPPAGSLSVRLTHVSPANINGTPREVVAPPCAEEDASGPNDAPVCRWDAGTAGLANGGESFTAYTMSDGVLLAYDNGERVFWAN